MARRHSLQSRPTSPGPPSSVHEPVFDPKDETSRGASNPRGRKRSSSVTGFFTKFLPSHRRERSGTMRDQGFWEQQQPEQPEPEQRPGLGHKHGSDSIVSNGWNPAIELPQRTQTTRERQTPLREQSQQIGNRPQSLTPHRQHLGERLRQEDGQPSNINNGNLTEAEVATSTVSRQPPDPGLPTENILQRPVTNSEAKSEARRLRRSLKESRDFLGVQGINPHTGVMDVLTPTSSSPTDRTMMSAPEPKGYSESMCDFRAAYQGAARTRDAEEASLERLRKEQGRLDKIQRNKDSIRAFQQRVRWRKDRNQWSSVAEPDLSPIADASTRSRTPRSTSDGAILPPPAIQKVLHWEEQRSVSTPAALQTAASTSQTRPEIVTLESSDTVIHTPHPRGDRRYSVAADTLGMANSSPEAARRASEPGPSRAVRSPGSSASDRGIPRKPVPLRKDKQKPPPLKLIIPGSVDQSAMPGPSNRRHSFLGMRIEPGETGFHHIRDQTIVDPSTPMEIGQDEDSRLGGPPNMDKTPVGSPPDVAVRDFACEEKRKVWFVDYPSGLGTARRKSSSADQNRGVNGATVTPSQPQQRTLHLYRTPFFPLRLVPSQKDMSLEPESETKNNPVNLIDIGMPFETKVPPAAGWAQELMDDLAGLGQDTDNMPLITGDNRESPSPTEVIETRRDSPAAEETTTETPRSACIPTTTITGYDPRLLAHTRGLHRRVHSDGAPEGMACKDDRVIRISATEAATKLELERRQSREDNDRQHRDDRATRVSTTELVSDESGPKAEKQTDSPPQKTTSTSIQQPAQPSFDLLASPPRLPPSVWPSLDIPAPHQRQHRMPQHHERRSTFEPTSTEMIPYGVRPGPANGTTLSLQHPDQYNRVELSVPAKTSLIYAAREPAGSLVPTSSAPQLAATRERCERLYRRVSRLHSPQGPNRQAMMTPAIGPCFNGMNSTPTPAQAMNIVPYRRPVANTASLTYTSTFQASAPKYRYMPPLAPSRSSNSSPSLSPSTGHPTSKKPHPGPDGHPTEVGLPREPATEAARTALMGTQCSAATGRIVHVGSRKRDKSGKAISSSTSTAAASGPDRQAPARLDGGSADTDGRSDERNDKEGVRRITLRDPPHAGRLTDTRKKKGENGIFGPVRKALVAYWRLIAPVFDAGSPVSKRFSAGNSTWHDCGLYLLALLFVLAAFLAAVWFVKGVLLVAGLGRAIWRGVLVLVGV